MLKIYSYANESVVYNINSGDLHLLSDFNASLLELMRNKILGGVLVLVIFVLIVFK